ncbi:thiol reductant ABC exporter subunit CydD [Leucobacter sp. M11]|uniref:thiol reductant ABC exporter subunit CydD n=1 Tax=Leucobacter sp. M11 TaxID=2993565 RepID=UPI002D8045D9|nr:thiol reductant ABC exporter subunit CydD [Leucobacter sp. M11]MEB4616683.1 thiol reductant ABC exporter subunit CydD [Leucobacter sp. M11]
MKPFDPRLAVHAKAIRGTLALGGLLGVLKTLAIVGWCWFLSQSITSLIEGSVAALPGLAAGAAASVILRSVTAWLIDVNAERGASRVKEQLRQASLDKIDELGQSWLGGQSQAEVTVRVTRGLDALDRYFSGYLPQLVMTVIATPVLVLLILIADLPSGITVIIVFPVIPMFMILIGLATQGVQDKQWTALTGLSRSFLDVIQGLPTLKIFGRERKQVDRIRVLTDEYRSRTMKVLRVTFLSGFVLDLAGTFSVALVAVTIGTRLVDGSVLLGVGLFVLLLVPEAFVPIRQVGAGFHASAEGLAAAEDIFDILETRPHQDSGAIQVTARGQDLVLDGVSVRHRPSAAPGAAAALAALDSADTGETRIGPASIRVAPGEIVALTGPSGVGKSTLVQAAVGLLPFAGALSVPGAVSWAGQRPALIAGTVAENVALGDAEPDAERVRRALAAADAEQIAPERVLGPAGSGLSGGQAQRVAIARCLYRAWRLDAGALLLDEPTAALDRTSEARVFEALRAEADAGRAVLIVTHREALRDRADRIVQLEGVLA